MLLVRKIILFLFLIYFGMSFNSCRTLEPCPDQINTGNAGALFNTSANEYGAFVFDEKFYFTSTRDGEPALYYAKIENGEFQSLRKDIELPLNRMEDGGMPTLFQSDDKTELYFSATNRTGNNSSRDIYFSEKINNRWSQPKPLEIINTEFYESYPFISKDGNYLLFISDREGGNGGIDIYISMRQSDGKWSEAINAGNDINSEFNEISPFLDDFNNLYFSSQAPTGGNDFEILKAEPVGSFKWKNPRLLEMPVNSVANETGAYINNGFIYFSSDREGGCGGEDLYSFQLCGPVYVKGKVIRKGSSVPIAGSVTLIQNNETIRTKDVDADGNFTFNLEPMREYSIEYQNDCFTQFNPVKTIMTPCSDTSSVIMNFNYVIPDMEKEFDFAEYDVPFFVSGYYYPNTKKNLEDLRLKFSYNLFTNEAETRYIENPDNNYDKYTDVVENALNDSYYFVNEVINSLQSECATRNLESISISVKGYADSRQISEYALYADNDIADGNLGVFVNKGQKMDNQLLSELRAYYTAKYIEDELKENAGYIKIKDRVEWNIEGMGIDESAIDDKLKRRVTITIKVN
jgi:hypothetical protein